MSLGGLYGLEQLSQGRLNKKGIFVGTGAEIAAVPLNSPAKTFICEETGSGYIADEAYFTKADESGRVSFRRKHTHDADTDEAGGDIYEIDIATLPDRIYINRNTRIEDFLATDQASSGGGGGIALSRGDNAILNSRMVTRLRTTTTTNNWTQLADGGKQLSMNSRVEWHITFQISHQSAILWRAGVGMEAVSASTNTSEAKFGMEGCDSDGVNIRLICCAGAGSRTNTNSEIAMDVGMRGYKMVYTPGTNIVWIDSSANMKTLTTNIPSTGSLAADRMLRYGIKLPSGTTEKVMYIAADAITGKVSDSLWV